MRTVTVQTCQCGNKAEHKIILEDIEVFICKECSAVLLQKVMGLMDIDLAIKKEESSLYERQDNMSFLNKVCTVDPLTFLQRFGFKIDTSSVRIAPHRYHQRFTSDNKNILHHVTVWSDSFCLIIHCVSKYDSGNVFSEKYRAATLINLSEIKILNLIESMLPLNLDEPLSFK